MASYFYSKEVVGASQIATSTPAAFCREIHGGRLIMDPNMIIKDGTSGQVHARKGTLGIQLDLGCVGVLAATHALWFPKAAGTTVAAFPDFLVEVDDGSTGQEYVLSGGQPRVYSASMSDAPDAEVELNFGMSFALATPQAAGTDVAVYNSYLGHTRGDITATLATVDEGMLSWEVSNEFNVVAHDPLVARSTNAKIFPESIKYAGQKQRLKCVTSNVYNEDLILDDLGASIAALITCLNGTAGENVTYTFAAARPYGSWELDLGSDVVAFAHEFGPATTSYNWCVVT